MTSQFIPFWLGVVALIASDLPTQVFYQSNSSKRIYWCIYILYECDFSWNMKMRRRMTLCTNRTNQTELATTHAYRYRSNDQCVYNKRRCLPENVSAWHSTAWSYYNRETWINQQVQTWTQLRTLLFRGSKPGPSYSGRKALTSGSLREESITLFYSHTATQNFFKRSGKKLQDITTHRNRISMQNANTL